MTTDSDPASADSPEPRRTFLATLPAAAMAGGLLASYGTFAAFCGRFLYPPVRGAEIWHLVRPVGSFPDRAAVDYRTPDGQRVTIRRDGSSGTVADFVALSSTCPHLGCQVHWEPQNTRFFCPCHNGVFDQSGAAVSGPPADAGQDLPRFGLRVESDLLFISLGETA